MLASFAEGRVGGHGAGPFPKEGSAQKDAEQHGRGVQGRKQQRLCWSPAWLPPGEGQVQLLLDREKGEGSSFSTLVASRWGFRVSCFTVGDPVWRLGVLTSWSWGPSVCSGV